MVLAQMIVEAPKYGASRRAAAISAPRLAEPTTNTITRTRAGRGGIGAAWLGSTAEAALVAGCAARIARPIGQG